MSKVPTRPRSRERYENKRQEITDTAAQLFAEQGYHGTSIDDLVAATGLQRGGLYHYIESKSELLVRIHERFIEPLLQEARIVSAANLAPDKALAELAHVHMETIEQHRDQMTVFLREGHHIRNAPEWKHIREARREYENIVLGLVNRGTTEGIFSMVDTKMTMMAFLGMFNYTYRWFDPSGYVSADELADQMCNIFLYGVVGRETHESKSSNLSE